MPFYLNGLVVNAKLLSVSGHRGYIRQAQANCKHLVDDYYAYQLRLLVKRNSKDVSFLDPKAQTKGETQA